MIDKTISHYKVLEKIGEGGMGVVYKALDTQLDRLVALKFLPPHISDIPEEKARFLHEARSASALNQPNITTIHGIEETPEGTFIVMEFVEGKTLKEIIEKHTPSIKKILEISIQICEGLAAAHKKEIVHRDIKSDNIMVTKDGQVKIMDFGLAKLKGASKLTKAGSTLGTAAYMSPEQASGEEVDQRSDIFSFGVVLYELLTRQLPFKGEHHAAIIYSILNEEPQPIARFNNQVSPKLEEMVSKAMAKDREERYQHIDDLLADLRHEKKNLEYVRTAALTQPVEIQKLSKKHMLPLVLAGVAVLILVVAYFAFFSKKQPASLRSGKPSIAVLYLQNLSESKEDEYFAAGMTEDIITDLSNIQGLQVLSRQDVLPYRGKQANIRTIGKELRVDYVMEGSVRRSGNQLRVTAQLIKVIDGFHVWANRFDRDLQDVFKVQAEIASSIAGALAIKLSAQEKQIVEYSPTSNMDAYDFYLKGRQYFDQRSKEDNAEAEKMFRQAITLDQNYALGYIGLAETFLQRVDWGFDPDRKWISEGKLLLDRAAGIDSTLAELYLGFASYYSLVSDYQQAIAAASRAVAIHPTDYYTHYLLGVCLNATDRWEEATREFQKSLELKPNYPEPYRFLASMALYSGKPEEAKQYINKAVELAPDAAHILNEVGWTHFLFGDFSKAELYFKRVIQLKPETPTYVNALGQLELFRGNLKEAIPHLEWSAKEINAGSPYLLLGRAYLLNGDRLQAEQAFRNSLRLSKEDLQTDSTSTLTRLNILLVECLLGQIHDPEPELKKLAQAPLNLWDRILRSYSVASIYTAAGKYDQAIVSLQEVLKSKAYSPQFIAADPAFESLRNDPRFINLVRVR
jgi:serine/threonine protein kinase/Flp pilus assembly protein TadD